MSILAKLAASKLLWALVTLIVFGGVQLFGLSPYIPIMASVAAFVLARISDDHDKHDR
jgi:hypothetical protein